MNFDQTGKARTVFIATVAISALTLGGLSLFRGEGLIELFSRAITQFVVPFNAMIMFGFAVIVSVVVGVFMHYYLFELKKDFIFNRDSAQRVVQHLRSGDTPAQQRIAEAKQMLGQDKTLFGTILRRFLSAQGFASQQPSNVWLSVQDEEFDRVKRNLMYFSLASVLAPAMGFLGTAVGMVAAFYQISIKDTVTPSDLATAIQIALITTVVGLVIKTFAMLLKTMVIHSIGRKEDQLTLAFQQMIER